MRNILSSLQKLYPDLRFTASDQYCWSPETGEIMYIKSDLSSKILDLRSAEWSLLHETGHALLEHQTYHADVELLRLEVAAWERAKLLAAELDIKIDEDHIQDCLDTYRDWLDKRSVCPTCATKSLQQDNHSAYHCYNCHATWRVSSNRFCRAYRISKNVPVMQTVFI